MEDKWDIEEAVSLIEGRLTFHRNQVDSLTALRDKLAHLASEVGGITDFLSNGSKKKVVKRKQAKAPRGSIVNIAEEICTKDDFVTAKAVMLVAGKKKIKINPKSIYATLLTSPKFARCGKGTFQLRTN